jgi:hypothetical protein
VVAVPVLYLIGVALGLIPRSRDIVVFALIVLSVGSMFLLGVAGAIATNAQAP